MKLTGLLRSTLFCALVIYASATTAAQDEAEHKRLPTAYCKVANHFAQYEHRVFRIRGVYRSGGEIMSFYDPSCPEADLTAWVDYSPEFRRRSTPALVSAMDKVLNADGRVQADVLAEFDGPKPVTVQVGTSSELAAVMQGTNSRYGHTNQFRFRLLFLQIYTVGPVPKTAPWPK